MAYQVQSKPIPFQLFTDNNGYTLSVPEIRECSHIVFLKDNQLDGIMYPREYSDNDIETALVVNEKIGRKYEFIRKPSGPLRNGLAGYKAVPSPFAQNDK